MTKKKKTLRAAILASIFAMSVCGSAWAEDRNESSYVSTEHPVNVHDSASWDGGYSPGDTTAIYSVSKYEGLTGFHANDKACYWDSTTESVKYGTGDDASKNNMWESTYGGGKIYWVEYGDTKIYNANTFSSDEINGVYLPAAVDPTTPNAKWDHAIHLFQMDYAATMAGFEAENRKAADEKLRLDDVKGIEHNTIPTTGNTKGQLTTTIKFNDGTSIQAETNLTDWLEQNAGDAYYNYNSAEGATNTTINAAITEALKHNTVIAGDTNINVDGTGTNDDGGIEYKVSLGTTLTGLESVTTKEVVTEKVTLGVGDNKTDITYNNTTNRIEYGPDENKQQVATLNDGTTYKGDTGKDAFVKLNQVVSLNGGGAVEGKQYITGNIIVDVEQDIPGGNASMVIKLADKLTGLESVETNTITAKESVTIGEGTTAISIKKDGTINNVENVETKSITLGISKTKVTFEDNRIVYGEGEEKENVATLNDYITYSADKVVEGSTDKATVKLRENLAVRGDNNITTYVDANSKQVQVTLNKDLKDLESVESNYVTVNETLTVDKNVTINKDGLTIEGDTTKVVVNETKVDVGGNKVENVAPGELSSTSKDAVNGSQLFDTNQRLDKLGNRVDKVGAGAAALAALHPLDFDPDDKLSFSAGVGNYGGETATALGAFYRPTEKVMFSAAGTMGNGENMVNMGVTFALDKTNNVSNSRVAMAREIQDLREQVAALTALVTQLAGRNNPALLDTVMFPDVPENHWAYDYIDGLQKRGIIEGYPDGNFGGDRSMTRYEYAAMLYRALEKGFPVDSRLLDEFDAELGRIRIDRIKGEDNDPNKTERVRVNNYQDRDDYGSKLVTVAAAK